MRVFIMHKSTIDWPTLYDYYAARRQRDRHDERASRERWQIRPLPISETVQTSMATIYSLCDYRRLRREGCARAISLLRCANTGNYQGRIFAAEKIRPKARIRKLVTPIVMDGGAESKADKRAGNMDGTGGNGGDGSSANEDRMDKGLVGKILAAITVFMLGFILATIGRAAYAVGLMI